MMVGSGAVTARFTLMTVEPVAPPAPLIRMVPIYWAATRFAGVTVTVSVAAPVAGVVPLVGDTESQSLPLVTAAEKPRLAPPPEIFTVPGVGFALPAWYENDSVVADVTVTVAAACTVRLTGTVTTVPPFGVMVMVALYGVDDGVRVIGVTMATVKPGLFTGVFSEVPFVTPAESQVALLAIVNETGADPDVLTTCKV